MWLILFLPFLALSRSFEDVYSFLTLRYSVLYISEQTTDWEGIEKKVNNITKNSEAYCKELNESIDYSLCKKIIDAFQTIHFATKYQVDKKMSNIPLSAEVVYVYNTIDDVDVNFNHLVNQKKVVIFDPRFAKRIDDDDDHNNTLKVSQFKTLNILTNSIFDKKTLIPKDDDTPYKINIIGNIKYRVSYLAVCYHIANFKYFDIDINTLVLLNTLISPTSLKIYAKNLIVNILSHSRIIEQIDTIRNNDLIHVHQYGLFYDEDMDEENNRKSIKDDGDDTFDEDIIDKDYQIVFQKDRWELLYKKHDSSDEYKSNEYYYFPYEFSDKFNFIVHSLNFDLNVNDSTIETAKGVNITVMNLYDYFTPITLLEDKKVSITSSGFWTKLKTQPTVIVCVDDDTSIEAPSTVVYEKHGLYSYSPLPPLPDPTSPPAPEGPKYERTSLIYVTSVYSECEEFKEQLDQMSLNYTEECKNEEIVESFNGDYEDCCRFYSSFGEYLCSNGFDINSKLGKISPQTDTLVIIDEVDNMQIDLSHLKEKMNVMIFGGDGDEEEKSRNKFIKNIKNRNINKKIKDDDEKRLTIYVQGNITEKVSYLKLLSLKVCIMDHEINVDSLLLFYCDVLKTSEPIRSTNLITTLDTHEKILSKPASLDLVKVNQYGVEFYDEETDDDPNVYDFLPADLRISFENDRWKVYQRDYYNKSDTYQTDDNMYVPYKYANMFNIIIKSLDFDLYVENSIIEKVQPINITVKNLNPFESYKKVLQSDDDDSSKAELKITTSGSWDSVKDKPEIVACLPDFLDFSASSSVKVNRENLYSYKPKTPPENPINPYVYPVLSYLCVSTTKSVCIKKQTEFEEEKENYKENCKDKDYYSNFDGGYTECLGYYSSLGEYYVSDGKDLNQVLSSVSNTTDILLFTYNIDDLTVDFNSLSSQMSVLAYNIDSDDDKFLYNKKINQISKSKKDPKKSKINLVGKISKKVSYLSVMYSNLNIIDHDLNVNTLYLMDSTFIDSEHKIRTTNFVVDEETQDYIIKNIDKINQKELIKVKQYGFNPSYFSSLKLKERYDDDDYINKDFRISFTNDRWLLLIKDHGSQSDYSPYTNNGKEFGYIPYSYADNFNLIAKAFSFDFYVQDSVIVKTQPVNVSIVNLNLNIDVPSKLFKHRDVDVTSSGNWEAVTNRTKVVFAIDDAEASIQPFAIDVDITQEKVYQYVPKSQRKPGDDGGGDDGDDGDDDDGDDDGDDGNKNHKKRWTTIIISCTVAGVVLVAVIIFVVWYVVSKKKKNNFNSSTFQSGNQLNQLLLNN